MPVYPNLPTVDYSKPEFFFRPIHEPLNIRSILDVGAGHGGVFDYGYWTERQMDRREACDIHWIREMDPKWKTQIGVNAQKLTPYADRSFDMVQCIETLEHVEKPEVAVDELIRVARKLVIITSADEEHHRGPEQTAIEKVNINQAYRRQPDVKFLASRGFVVTVIEENRRQIVAWKIM